MLRLFGTGTCLDRNTNASVIFVLNYITIFMNELTFLQRMREMRDCVWLK